jgi:chitin disaccharide deacetylase
VAERRLIVNADDFGRSPGVNRGVLEAHLRGIVTSATVMVLEAAAAHGIREAVERAPRLSLGLHFVVTGGGRPASPPRELPILAPNGSFRRNREELPPAIPAEEVRRELEEQIRIFQVLARKAPTHLDSHHHAALHSSVAPVFAEAAFAHSLPVRASSDEARRRLRAAKVRTPDRFYEGFYAAGVSLDTLARILEDLPEGTSELMCHPGLADEELRRSSTYADERELEVAVLCDPKVRELVRRRGIALRGFGAL